MSPTMVPFHVLAHSIGLEPSEARRRLMRVGLVNAEAQPTIVALAGGLARKYPYGIGLPSEERKAFGHHYRWNKERTEPWLKHQSR
jgi:hypothetical protein